ncbi:MAG: DUF1592 domain-containing protein [Planctomycetota bacterium]|nr:DUF1592 domain-containing protein [Planctomycetota bacterium]
MNSLIRYSLRLVIGCLSLGMLEPGCATAADPTPNFTLVRSLCVGCHSGDKAEAGLDLQRLMTSDSFGIHFRTWQRVVEQLEQSAMPPGDADQPTRQQRRQLVTWIRERINAAATKQAHDPGHVVIRRLTSAEYAYAVEDLTGLDLSFDRDFVGDVVGGAGFTNTGIVQFTQGSTLERYLEAARRVSEHAIVGTGPLRFFRDPGQSGLELASIERIQSIYRKHGFRTAAGEGGEEYGGDRYPTALLVAWKFRHRERLGLVNQSLAAIADRDGVDVRFAEFIHGVMQRRDHSFPTSQVVDVWQRLPIPKHAEDLKSATQACREIAKVLMGWQNRFGSNIDAKEEAPVLRPGSFHVDRTLPFEMNVNWPEGTKAAHLVLSVESANRSGSPDAVVRWSDARIQFRDYGKQLEDPKPLRNSLSARIVKQLKFGDHPRGGEVGPDDFVSVGTKPVSFELPIPEGARSARMLVTAKLDIEHGEDCIVRCSIRQLEETDQGKSVSGLLANPKNASFASWRDGVLEFARLLPQASHQEPAPSDRDPIPAPLDASYNNPERNFFHTRIKYFRDDEFLVNNVLNAATRRELDQAWADLLTSFEYHDTWLQVLDRKYGLDLNQRRIDDLDDAWISKAPPESRRYLTSLKAERNRFRRMSDAAEIRHWKDVIDLAARAWRRPLRVSEQHQLQAFYRRLRTDTKLAHRAAVCATIARVLVSPAFLYRAEPTIDAPSGKVRLLSPQELASRLSFFLWSSIPDAELRRAADAGELATSEQIAAQARRMLQSPKARRFATEFFGQWFGFYRFDKFSGIDGSMFPEFSESLRQAMYEEAVEFFNHIVRGDRPVNEILFADYSFVNRELAAHYGLDFDFGKSSDLRRVDHVTRFHRGGLLRLGALLVTTSAPRRTSPVKRGDWILRRLLGTAVPPPPADAGSIAADEVAKDGSSIRQRLIAHRRDASCRNCHARFDAFGFALENFDPLGRWRDRYRDQQLVETGGELRDGTKIQGDQELHAYLRQQQSKFHDTFARKLIGYALGRRQVVGDLPLTDRLIKHMADGGGIAGLVERVVVSPQFRNHRASQDDGS